MKKQNIMPSVILGAICLTVALLLSCINMITGPIIEAAQNAAANEALLIVLPEGENFEELTTNNPFKVFMFKSKNDYEGLYNSYNAGTVSAAAGGGEGSDADLSGNASE